MVRRLEGHFQPMDTEDSAGAQYIWGFGKEFVTGVHPVGSNFHRFGNLRMRIC